MATFVALLFELHAASLSLVLSSLLGSMLESTQPLFPTCFPVYHNLNNLNALNAENLKELWVSMLPSVDLLNSSICLIHSQQTFLTLNNVQD